ncbi:LmbU family transcriptional regulator [Streptomyces sp. B6B3]|jgi:hypothetical protein|uniref:LmbU family transcriptional regulator n=1 Tax=Streptomyces sp. B6B3 TaxID=3153570 RepID=UPI00325C490D
MKDVNQEGGILVNQPSPTGRPAASTCTERLALDRVAETRRTSLALRAGLNLADWKRVGLQLSRISDSSTWWLGDWLRYGREHYPRRYRQAVEETALDYQTLRNYAWVAGKVAPSERRPGLSFQHHAEVAPLPRSQQGTWLERAELNGWSRNRLRTEIRAAGRRDLPVAQVVQLRVDDAHLARWRQAADVEGRELLDWMTDILDQEADTARLLGGETPGTGGLVPRQLARLPAAG